MHKLTQLKNKLIAAAQDKRQKSDILAISELFESILADYELRAEQQDYTINRLINSLSEYGITPQQAMNTNRVDNTIKVPERLLKYIDWQKVESDHLNKKALELIKEFPHLEAQIRKTFQT